MIEEQWWETVSYSVREAEVGKDFKTIFSFYQEY